jgi:RNA polymerase sigma factor (sigma-70 family)
VNDPGERFTALYDRHYRSVLGYTLLRAGQDAAEDVVSETFLVAWRRLDDLPDPPLPWLLGVARNLLYKQYDSGRRRQALADRVTALTRTEDLAGPDVAERVVERDAARAALGSLGERDVEALVLATWYGLSPREAARVVGCSAAAFTVRLHRARKRLAGAPHAHRAPDGVALIQEEAR